MIGLTTAHDNIFIIDPETNTAIAFKPDGSRNRDHDIYPLYGSHCAAGHVPQHPLYISPDTIEGTGNFVAIDDLISEINAVLSEPTRN